MKKVIVTGANGFIGSALIQKLSEERIEVVAINPSFAHSRLPASDYITLVETELHDAEQLRSSIPPDTYDAFFHLAWQGVNGAEKADPVIQTNNVIMALNCASVANQIGCKKYLCAGTIAERAVESLSHLKTASGGMLYGAAKCSARLMLETYCKHLGMDFVWMQFSNIYGPSNKTGNLVSYTLEQLMSGQPAVFGPAQQPYDFIFIGDLIEALFRLGSLEHPETHYFIGSGKPRLLKDYLQEIGRIYGREDLIQIGMRPDDGIVYTMDMFDTSALIADIGNYVSKDFTESIRYTIKNYG